MIERKRVSLRVIKSEKREGELAAIIGCIVGMFVQGLRNVDDHIPISAFHDTWALASETKHKDT